MAFTGQGTALRLQGNKIGEAQQRMNDLILRTEEIRLKTFKENQDWFLKTSDLPVESFVNQANIETQSKFINEFNKEAQAILKQRGSFENFTTEDKLALMKARTALETEQERMLADKKKYDIAREEIRKNPNLYSEEKFNILMADTYYQSGRFPDQSLPLKAKSLGSVLASNTNKIYGTATKDYTYYTDEFGKKVKQPVDVSATEEQSREHVRNWILKDEQVQEAAKEEFDALPDVAPLDQPSKWKYLKDFDTNKDGTIDQGEMRAVPTSAKPVGTSYNPIIAYQQDKYWQMARVEKEGTITSAEPPRPPSEKDQPIGVKKRSSILLSGQTYSEPYEFSGEDKINYVPIRGARMLLGITTEGGKGVMDVVEDVITEGYIKLYDAYRDVVVIKEPGVNGNTYEVPASNLRIADLRRLRANVDGKNVSIEDVRNGREPVPTVMRFNPQGEESDKNKPTQTTTQNTPKMSFAEWKAENPTKTPQDYQAYLKK